MFSSVLDYSLEACPLLPVASSPAGASRDTTWSDNTGVVFLFHFSPDENDGYEYVHDCSGRGICTFNGVCNCFDGYTGVDCSIQSVLATFSKELEDEDIQAWDPDRWVSS